MEVIAILVLLLAIVFFVRNTPNAKFKRTMNKIYKPTKIADRQINQLNRVYVRGVKKGNFKKAIRFCNRILPKADWSTYNFKIRLADMYMHEGEYNKAWKVLEKLPDAEQGMRKTIETRDRIIKNAKAVKSRAKKEKR